MLQITPYLAIPEDELLFTFVRASGPGGQNVNKVATAAQLRFNIDSSSSLPPDVKERLKRLAGERVTQNGILVIEARRYRSQEQNRFDAEQRLAALIQKALVRPKKRRPTKPSAASQERRIEKKKIRGDIKRQRQMKDPTS